MSHFTLVSRTHSLFPLAHRLLKEGHEVRLLVWKRRFTQAWRGALQPETLELDGGGHDVSQLERLVGECERAASTLVSDVIHLRTPTGNVPNRYLPLRWEVKPTSPLRVGGWWDGEALRAPHGIVVDQGAWPGGLGAQVPGGFTLLSSPIIGQLATLWAPVWARLKSESYRGLVQAGVQPTLDGGVELHGVETGWPFLHYHAFLSELESIGEVLTGAEPLLPRRFVVVAPLSVPPWPSKDARGAESRPVEGLTPQQRGRVFWHDTSVAEGKLLTGGLDGLVGVARGAAGTLDLARGQVLETLLAAQVYERQFRPDVGGQVGRVLADLEQAYGVVL